jgi:hypothetical protein
LLLACLLVLGGSQDAAAQGKDGPRIIVPPTIVAAPASQTSLSIVVGPPGKLPHNSFLRLRGLPTSVSLTEGHAIAPGSWAIPLIGLPSLKAVVPAGVSGRSEITIQLIGVDGTTFAESRTALVVGPPTMVVPGVAPPEKSPADTAKKRARTTPPPTPPAKSDRRKQPRPPELTAEQKQRAERLVGLGERHLEQGNIGAARMFFQRAAEAGLALGAIRLAATYDPMELGRLQAQGVVADPAQARRWYERARELGAAEADERLARLGAR